jgi:4-diphosphocytidyl-2-C-methyl-D-erythritol kinase
MIITLRAPAKINWFLKVYGLRNNGYHNIKSLIQKVSLYDILSFSLSDNLVLLSDLQIPAEENLVYKAAILLKNECGVKEGAQINLKKNIPVAAGLGGGSSDAASTLIGLNELWSLGLSTEELCVFAERLGSDVRFFISANFGLVEGRGERITALKAIKSFDILLVKPRYINVSTRWVYENYKLKQKEKTSFNKFELTNLFNKFDNIDCFIHTIKQVEEYKGSNNLNDLESVTVARFPVIADIKKRLREEGAVFSLMSGSGPTVFGVFASAEEAKKASEVFKDCWTAVVQTITEEN